MRVYLVRHGEYVWACAGERGPGLSVYGRAQAQAAGAYLAACGVRPVGMLVSPYARAQETAAVVAEVLGEAAGRAEWVELRSLLPEGEVEETLEVVAAWAESAQGAEGDLVVVGHMGSIGRLARAMDPIAPGSFGLCTVAAFEGDGRHWRWLNAKDCGSDVEL